MPRAHRHFLNGLAWHITQRCHKRQFLLKFQKDRRQWRRWLYQARKRYGLCILNYIVTSNHTHLMVLDQGHGEISRSMKLVAGCVGQQFNRRKGRNGAFWEDRYFATAVETDSHLMRCLAYIDLNMVRAGVVRHPEEWSDSGYREIQSPPQRYRLIDCERLARLLGFSTIADLQVAQKEWVQESLSTGRLQREPKWTEAVAVGRPEFLSAIQRELYLRCPGRQIKEKDGEHWISDSLVF